MQKSANKNDAQLTMPEAQMPGTAALFSERL
jgi:hypothetical protein